VAIGLRRAGFDACGVVSGTPSAPPAQDQCLKPLGHPSLSVRLSRSRAPRYLALFALYASA
jgi:hypothetical protein